MLAAVRVRDILEWLRISTALLSQPDSGKGTWKERSGVLPPLDESPLRQDSVTATKFCGSWTWRVAQQRGLEELGYLRPAGGGTLFPKNLCMQISSLFISGLS